MGSELALFTNYQHIPETISAQRQGNQLVQSLPLHATAPSAVAVSLSPLQILLFSFYATPPSYPGSVMPPRQWSGLFESTLQQGEICPGFWCDSSVATPVLSHPCYHQARLTEVKSGSHSSHGAYGSHCLVIPR